jgi:hypothetical protein
VARLAIHPEGQGLPFPRSGPHLEFHREVKAAEFGRGIPLEPTADDVFGRRGRLRSS